MMISCIGRFDSEYGAIAPRNRRCSGVLSESTQRVDLMASPLKRKRCDGHEADSGKRLHQSSVRPLEITNSDEGIVFLEAVLGVYSDPIRLTICLPRARELLPRLQAALNTHRARIVDLVIVALPPEDSQYVITREPQTRHFFNTEPTEITERAFSNEVSS